MPTGFPVAGWPMHNHLSPILMVEGLVKVFDKPGTKRKMQNRAVDGVSFTVNSGEVYGLIGASGSGKTTTLKLIFGLEKPDDGQVFFRGVDLIRAGRAKTKALRRKMGLVFQDPYNSLCPRYTVQETLAEPLLLDKRISTANQAEKQIAQMLDKMELPIHFTKKYPHQLSGGERQRVALGRALMLNPVLLALDEPTSMLDASTKKEMISLLKNLVDEMGLAVLLVTHDLAMAGHICDRIAVMKTGKIVETGETNELITAPSQGYTQQLLLAATDLESFWEENEKKN